METFKSITYENMHCVLHCILVFGTHLNKFIFQLLIKHRDMRIQNLIILLPFRPIKLLLRMNFKIFFSRGIMGCTRRWILSVDRLQRCQNITAYFLIPHLKFYTSHHIGLKCTLCSPKDHLSWWIFVAEWHVLDFVR